MTNWERKSSYLLREIVKFRTYIDSLTAAQTLKDKIYAKREAEASASTEDGGDSAQLAVSTDFDGVISAPQSSEPIKA